MYKQPQTASLFCIQHSRLQIEIIIILIKLLSINCLGRYFSRMHISLFFVGKWYMLVDSIIYFQARQRRNDANINSSRTRSSWRWAKWFNLNREIRLNLIYHFNFLAFKTCVSRGGKAHMADALGQTALHFATSKGHLSIVKFIQKYYKVRSILVTIWCISYDLFI